MPCIGSGTIEAYKLGRINFEEFHKRIDSQLGLKTSEEEFKNAWNAMCEVTDIDIARINSLLALQKERGFELCVVAGTNQAQYDFIQAKLKEKGINIPVTTSFENATLDLHALTAFGMPQTPAASGAIISLHSGISNANHSIFRGKNFTCRPVNPSKENIADVLKSLTRERAVSTNASEGVPANDSASTSREVDTNWVDKMSKPNQTVMQK